MVSADRAAGFPSTSVVSNTRQASYALVTESDFDVVLESPNVFWGDTHWLALIHLLRNGDIWNTHFRLFFEGGTALSKRRLNTWTFRLLRWVGIRIVAAPLGSDVAYRDTFRDRFDWVGRMQSDYPEWDLVRHGELTRERVELFCRYAHVIIGNDSTVARFLPRNDIFFKCFPADCSSSPPRVAVQRERPLVIHAPNHRNVKGSDYLISAVDRLRSRGIECDLVLVEGMEHEEALRVFESADIIADQFIMGAYGVFALEAMAMGKTVLTYLDHEHLGNPVFNLPVVNANPENLEAVLGVLLQSADLRRRIGAASRASIERFQSVEALAEVWRQIYRHIWWGEGLSLSNTRHFSPERTARSYTEDPTRAEFWPVDVNDMLHELETAMRRIHERREEVVQ